MDERTKLLLRGRGKRERIPGSIAQSEENLSATARSLPDYKKPPVVEVVIGIRFAPLGGLSTVHYGNFWSAVKEEYPLFEDKPPLPSQADGGRSLLVETFEIPPLRRVFMLHEDQSYLLQLQPDFFLHNWKKVKDDDEYPHFDKAAEKFKNAWKKFQDFVKANKLGELRATSYEVTYVNHFVEKPGSFPMAARSYTDLFVWRDDRSDKFLSEPKSLALDLVFPLPGDKGRLTLSIRHGRRDTDKQDVMQAHLTAVGPAQTDGSDLDQFLSVAHESIVRGFTELTNAEAHKKWERIQ
jgi:uncharacterized protein (TIGR04255 family)